MLNDNDYWVSFSAYDWEETLVTMKGHKVPRENLANKLQVFHDTVKKTISWRGIDTIAIGCTMQLNYSSGGTYSSPEILINKKLNSYSWEVGFRDRDNSILFIPKTLQLAKTCKEAIAIAIAMISAAEAVLPPSFPS